MDSRWRDSKHKRIKTSFLKPKSSLAPWRKRSGLEVETPTVQNKAAKELCADFSTANC
jgi:hypothetical protein